MARTRFDVTIRRRELLLGAAAGARLAGLLPACASPGGTSAPAITSSSDAAAPPTPAAGAPAADSRPASLVLSSWGNPGDLKSLRQFADDYHTQHPNVSIDVQVTPSSNFDEWFGTRLHHQLSAAQHHRGRQVGRTPELGRHLPGLVVLAEL